MICSGHLPLFQGPHNVDHTEGDFFWADISAFEVFSDPDFCYDVMPKIFKYLQDNSELKERDIYVTFNDIKRHHVGRNGKPWYFWKSNQIQTIQPGVAIPPLKSSGKPTQ